MRSGPSARMVKSVVIAAGPYQPAPEAIPIAATTHSVAAVVSPRTEKPCRMIAPAPRKPTPVTICAAIRVGSVRTMFPPPTRNSWKPYAETSVKRQEPTETSRCVRKPASRSRSSRSRPTAPPRPAATTTRSSSCSQVSVGISSRSIERRLLDRANRRDPRSTEIEQLVELLAVERGPFGGRLHLDQPFVAGHDDVQVHFGARVLDVVQVEQQLAADDPERDGRDRLGQGAREPGLAERPRGR